MRTFFLTLFLFIAPAIASAQVTKPVDLVSAQYTLLFSPDRNRHGEGVYISYEMAEKKTRIGFGFNHTELNTVVPVRELTGISVGINGLVAGLPVNLDITLEGITYTSKRTGSIFDFLLLGEYNYFGRGWGFGTGDVVRKTHDIKFWAGVGAKIDVSIQNTEYSIFVDGELFDTLENPLSHSKSSKLKFLISHGVDYRFSMLKIGVHTVLSVPTVKKSFVLMSFGISI